MLEYLDTEQPIGPPAIITNERLAEMRRMAQGIIDRQGEDASAKVLLSEVVGLIDNVELWQGRAVASSVARADSLHRANAAETAVEAVLALHQPHDHGMGTILCKECSPVEDNVFLVMAKYPCATVKAIKKAKKQTTRKEAQR